MDDDTGEDTLAWETLDDRTAYSCEGFDVVNEDVRLPDGTETEFDYLSEPPSVVVIPFLDDPGDEGAGLAADRELVVIEEWRHAVGRVNRGLPAGGLEGGEDPEEAALRELEEETGYVADRVEPMGTFEPANGIANAVLHYFVAYGCSPVGDQELDYNESIRVETASLWELQRGIARGEVRDGRTALGILYHQLHG